MGRYKPPVGTRRANRRPAVNAPYARTKRATPPKPVEPQPCGCMTEDPGDGYGERVVTHSLSCPLHPEHEDDR